jgi:hypothetical protein
LPPRTSRVGIHQRVGTRLGSRIFLSAGVSIIAVKKSLMNGSATRGSSPPHRVRDDVSERRVDFFTEIS